MTGATEWAVAPVIFCYNNIYDASGTDTTVKMRILQRKGFTYIMDLRKYKASIDFSDLAW